LFPGVNSRKLRRINIMPSQSTEFRRLAAIMFTDMVGYSALSQRNETLALELLEEHRTLLRTVFPKHQGQEIKSTGDGFLVEFASALAAVQCAVEIQKLMRQRNESRSAERRVLIRIGIHLGDVVRRENDVFGDGVNIAARIEPLAEPGGICVSRAVYEQIENKVEHALVQLSRPTLKNIQATVEVYRLLLDEPRARKSATASPRRKFVIASVVLAAAVVGLMAFLKSRPHPASSLQTTNTTAPAHLISTVPTNTQPARAVEFQVLHSFGPTNREGVNGWGVVTLSRDGFLYGCLVNSGPGGAGSIYRVRTNGEDHAVLRSFDRTNDGAEPTGGVIETRDGILFGTTFRGGKNDAGVIFRLAKDGRDYRVLHHFAASNDCRYPQSELLEAKDGWIYGTATGGGGHGLGGVFKIARDGSGYAVVTGFFRGQPDDPCRPVGGLIEAADGFFYGTTRAGGLKNNGTVFRLDAAGNLTVLKSLGITTGGVMQPEGTLLLGSDGALYGTAALGGTVGGGAVFRMATDGNNFSIRHHFGTVVGGPRQPNAGLIQAADGSLLGTTFAGGTANLGAVFRLDLSGNDCQVLHHFTGGYADGLRSRSILTAGGNGVFYSATLNGGERNAGVVYRLSSPGL
jgi:uncharacterized repeat protein (TIGR03803 family)